MLKKFIKATTVEVSKGVDKKVISVFVIATLFGFFAQVVFATPPSSPYTPGETLNPSCSPGDTNCDVSGAFVGDSGSGGTKGLVPAPAAGDAAASKFLSADGTWTVPSGSGNVSKVGTPADNQVGVWTGDGTIEGTSGLTYDGSNLQLTGDIGSTGTRITKGWFTDLVVTNDISGSITGNAASVTNGLYTTDISSTVQAYDADLDTWATLTPSANAQSLVTAADYAAMRALLDLEAGTDFYSISAADAAFQPLDSDLTTIAGLTATSNNFMVAASSAWSSMTPTAATALLDAVVGDSGAGGTKGLVPAPGAGDAAASKFLKADGTWATAGGSSALSGLTAASATNTLANVNYAQVWNWDSLANETAFQLGSTSITSGKLLDLSINGTAAESSQTGLNISLAGANASSTVTSYGAYITNTHYGTSATNVALYASASSGTTNYAAQFYGSVYMDDGAFAYDSSTGITTVDNLNLGTLNFDTDAGIVTWVDLPVTSAASSGTVESYRAKIDGTTILSLYAQSDGAGGIKDDRVGIGTTTPTAKLGIISTQSTGTLMAVSSSTTLAGTLTGESLDLKTNVVNAAQSVTGLSLSLPGATAASTTTIKGFTIASPGAVVNSAGTSTWTGLDITMPDITQSAGSLTSTGIKITGGTVTSGTAYALTTSATAGNVGIANTAPGALLDIGTAGTTLGTMRLEGDTSGYVQIQPASAAGSYTLTLPDSTGTASQFLQTDGTGVLTWATPTASAALSGLSAASATNTLANVNYAQVWNWDSLANETAFQLGSTSITSGKLLDLSINGTAAESSQTGLNISLAGANASSTVTSYGAYITNTHYGTSATNVALYASASSGTTNYAAQFYGSVYMDDGAFAYDSSTGITTVDNLNLGTLNFDTDAGIVTWVDLPVTSAASSGTVESYTAAIDGTSILTVYAESDGTGSIQNQGVGIGTATPAYMLDVLGTGTGGVIARFNDSNTTGCTLATDGTISCSSDINLKKNIVTLDGKDFVLSENDETDWSSEGVLARLMSITPVTYNWKSELNTDSKHIGLIAQDVERVFPDIVTTDKTTGYKSLGYTNFIPYTIKAVQELDLNLEGIAGTITPLEGSDNASFVATFFDNLFAKIREWLASATNGIMHFFAKEVNTNTLCVSDDSGAKTCITKDQLDSLLSNAGVSAGVTGGNTDTNTPSNNTDTTSDNTADTSSNDSTGTVSSENNTADTPEDTTTDTTTDNSDTTPPSSETTEGQGTDTATSEGDTSDTSSSDTTDSTNSSQTTTETTSTDDSSDATGDTSTSSDNSSSTSSDTSSSDSSSQDSGSGGDTASGN